MTPANRPVAVVLQSIEMTKTQERKLLQSFCRENGYKIAAWFHQEERFEFPGISALLNYLSTSSVEAVVAYGARYLGSHHTPDGPLRSILSARGVPIVSAKPVAESASSDSKDQCREWLARYVPEHLRPDQVKADYKKDLHREREFQKAAWEYETQKEKRRLAENEEIERNRRAEMSEKVANYVAIKDLPLDEPWKEALLKKFVLKNDTECP